MLFKPIVLHVPKSTLTSDDAGISITQYELLPPPSSITAPYHLHANKNANPTLSYVPSLAFFCINALLEWPDQVHTYGPRRPYQPPSDRSDFDILQALIPTYRPFSPHHRDFDLRLVDPRLWAVLVQLYEPLPPAFRTYTLPLSDVHLPLLQRIPSTAHFSLLTVLSLARCSELTDDTVVELRELHTLAALDASLTALGSFGLLRLAKTLSWTEPDSDSDAEHAPERRGPWGLRVLYLKDCINVDDKLLDCLPRFPLLSVVDLRGTRCAPWLRRDLPFRPSADTRLYDAGDMPGVLAHLSSLTAGPGTLFSHPAPHVLFVDSLYHRVDPVSARGWGSPLAKPSAERGRQVASGRMDVFLPYSAPRPEFPPYVEDDEYPQDCGLQNIEDMLPEEDEVSSSSDSELEEQPPGRWDMPDPQSAEGPRPSHPRPERGGAPTSTSSWMEEAAGREQRMLADRMLADRFYSAPARRRTPSKPSSFAAPKPRPPPPKPPAAAAAADPRTLFRPPPPWSSLPAQPPPRRQAAAPAGRMPTGVFASPSAAHTPRPQGAPAAQTRKRMVTLSSVQHMLDMVQKRSSGPDKAGRARAAPPSVPLGRANPFARSAQATAAGAPRLPLPKAAAPSALAPALDGQRPAGRARSPEPEGHPRPRASPRPRPPANARTDHARPGPSSKSVGKRPAPPPSPAPSRASCGTSRPDPSPSRPAKRLKPITTLTVPDWPGARMKPLSEHNRKLQPPTPSAGTAPKAQRQTTLSATTGARGSGGERTLDDVAGAKAQAQRRVPAPRPAPRRLEVAALKLERGQSIAAKPKGGGTEKGGRKPSGGGTGKAFDWKGWSAG